MSHSHAFGGASLLPVFPNRTCTARPTPPIDSFSGKALSPCLLDAQTRYAVITFLRSAHPVGSTSAGAAPVLPFLYWLYRRLLFRRSPADADCEVISQHRSIQPRMCYICHTAIPSSGNPIFCNYCLNVVRHTCLGVHRYVTLSSWSCPACTPSSPNNLSSKFIPPTHPPCLCHLHHP